MNKCIAVFDGLRYDQHTEAYAIALATEWHMHLTGVFLDDRTYTSYKIYELVLEEGVSEHTLNQYREKDRLTRKQAADQFAAACKTAGIPFNVHHDHKAALPELIRESMYADLMVIGYAERFSHHDAPTPSRFIRDLLHDTRCPVFLVKKEPKPIEKILFLFDGRPQSMVAFRQFNYVAPLWKDKPVEILTVKSVESHRHVPDYWLLKEFARRHYTQVTYEVEKGIPEQEVRSYLQASDEELLIVLGAYSRSPVSRWLRNSMADTLMQSFDYPLFVAHT